MNLLQEFAYQFTLSETSGVQVYAALESSLNKIDGFSETGADTASLVADDQNAWATDVNIGARYTTAFNLVDFAPKASFSAHAGLVMSVGDTAENIRLHFAGAPNCRYIQSAADRERLGYTVGAGLNVPLDKNISLFVSGSAILRGDSHELNANVGMQFGF